MPNPDLSREAARSRAYKDRPDYQAALERVKAAETARAAASGDSMPSVRLNADYGALGLTPADAHATYTITGLVSVPIFQGNRTKGRILEADADLRSRRAEADDMRAGIYYEVRTAFLDLQATQRAVGGRDAPGRSPRSPLTQARDRFAAGVADNIEVVQAQEAVSLATSDTSRAP